MARNREPVKTAESESVESEDDEDSSEDTDSEPEQTQTKKSQPPPPPPLSSSEEEESGSESDSDSNVKSLAMEETQKSIEPNAQATKFSAAKRPAAEVTATNDAKKKSKMTDEPGTSEKKPHSFTRFWSEDDEIVILQGMIDYTAEKKSPPHPDLIDFLDYIKENLHIDFTRVQLQDKLRRLKKKYVNNKSREKEGKGRTFPKPHDQKQYDLSELIWGNGTAKENGGASSSKGKEVVKDVNNAMEEKKRLSSNIPSGGGAGVSMEERMLRTGKEFYEEDRRVEMKLRVEEWEKLRVEEMLLCRKHLELRLAQTNLVLNGFNVGDH